MVKNYDTKKKNILEKQRVWLFTLEDNNCIGKGRPTSTIPTTAPQPSLSGIPREKVSPREMG